MKALLLTLSMIPVASLLSAESSHLVASLDADKNAGLPFAHGAAVSVHAEKSALAPVAGHLLRIRFTGLVPAKTYAVRLVGAADRARTLAVFAGPHEVAGKVELSAGGVSALLPVPAAACEGGSLRLSISSSDGKPALAKVEVFSDAETPLRPEASTPDLLAPLAPPAPRVSPRPAEVAGVANARLSLDGEWSFRASPESVEARILVPGEWAMQGFAVKPGEPALYRRSFNLPADWAGRRVKLRFDAVSFDAVARVNGRRVGAHAGGFVPFEFDVTDALVPGANTIEVEVRSETLTDILSTASQYAAHPVGGLLRPVSLFALPSVNVAALDTLTEFDASFRDATLSVSADLANEGDGPADAEIVAMLRDPDGKPVNPEGDVVRVTGIPAGGVKRAALRIAVPSAKSWDTEHPRLYTLELGVRKGGEVTQRLTRRVGLRTVRVSGGDLLINGKPVKLLGACRHEVDPLTGRMITAEQARRDAVIFRAGNANFLRTSHYPACEAFLEACDELGILVESEAAVCWVEHPANPHWKKWDNEDPVFFNPIVRASLDNVAAFRGHPCVVLWSIANESRWSPLFAKTDAVVRACDASRPTTFHDQCWGDFNNAGSRSGVSVYHYPDENGPALTDKTTDRPTYFGEYAHVQCYNRREWHTDPFVRADWGRPFARMVDRMWEHRNCLGGAIWAGIDDLFHLPPALGGDLVGYGPWGVIDGWRREKPEYVGMRNAYARVKITAPVVFADGAWTVSLENRYDFADLSEVPVAWRCGDQGGVVRVSAAPRTAARLVIRPERAPKPGEALRLTFTDPRGFVALEREFGAVVPAEGFGRRAASPAPAELAESADGWTVRVPGVSLSLARATGALSLADDAGRRRLLGLPVPMLLELNGSGGAEGPAGSVFTNNLEAFTPVDTAWQVSRVSATRLSTTAVRLDVAGKNRDAEGVVSLTVEGDGALRFAYDVKVLRALNPRQRGLAFELPRDHDTLRWIRAAEDASFDPHDIARKYGTAKASPSTSPLVMEPRVRPSGPWALDASPLGTNDFRSTKAGVLAASLTDASGEGLAVVSDGSQAVRSWVDGDRIRLLVADFNTGGCDSFFETHYSAERRPLHEGDRVAGAVELRPVHKGDAAR